MTHHPHFCVTWTNEKYCHLLNTKQMHCHKFSINISASSSCILSYRRCSFSTDEVDLCAKCKHKMLDKFPVNVWPFFSFSLSLFPLISQAMIIERNQQQQQEKKKNAIHSFGRLWCTKGETLSHWMKYIRSTTFSSVFVCGQCTDTYTNISSIFFLP